MTRNLIIILTTFILGSCTASFQATGEKKIKAPENPGITLAFENQAGGQAVTLNKDSFTNASGEKFTISLLQYFISNISFTKKDGSVVTIPQDQSYFLVKESAPESQKISLPVPEGNYESVTFILGVDSLRNTKPLAERTGVLDPATGAEGMYWSWNSGYIFFKMEGGSPVAPPGKLSDHKYRYHIGLFGGMNSPTVNNVKTITLSLKNVKVGGKNNPVVHISADVLKMFTGVNTISIAKNSTVMVSPFSKLIADNYASMFSISKID